MSPKIIIPQDHPGVGLKRAQRRSAKRTNFKLKEQLALKSNRFIDEINKFMSRIISYFYIISTILTIKQIHTLELAN